MIKSYIKFSGVILFLLVLVLVSVLYRNSDYRTFTFPEDDPYFSFEYPVYYRIQGDSENLYFDDGYLMPIGFEMYSINIENQHSYLAVIVLPLYTINTPENMLGDIAEVIGKEVSEIIKKEFVIYGSKAYQISYSEPCYSENINYIGIHEELIFEHNQVVWILVTIYDQSLAKEKGAEFQHLIDSLKIFKDF